MRATLKNYNQSPRKVRLVANLIRGKSVDKALEILKFIDKKSAPAIRKLLLSAISNAKQKNLGSDNLFVKEIFVNEGIKLKRWMPRAFGRASIIRKRKSHITIILAENK